jgi:hypothetical protein
MRTRVVLLVLLTVGSIALAQPEQDRVKKELQSRKQVKCLRRGRNALWKRTSGGIR